MDELENTTQSILSQCEKCKHGKSLSIEEFEEMGEWKVSCDPKEWKCYQCALKSVTKRNGKCLMFEKKQL